MLDVERLDVAPGWRHRIGLLETPADPLQGGDDVVEVRSQLFEDGLERPRRSASFVEVAELFVRQSADALIVRRIDQSSREIRIEEAAIEETRISEASIDLDATVSG